MPSSHGLAEKKISPTLSAVSGRESGAILLFGGAVAENTARYSADTAVGKWPIKKRRDRDGRIQKSS